MEENNVHSLIATETVEPKRRPIRSLGALYVVMLLLVVGVIAAGNALSAHWNVPRIYIQLTMYAILLALGWYAYRFYLTSFCYTLTDRLFAIERVVGKKQRADECIRLGDITRIQPFDRENTDGAKVKNLSARAKADSLAVTVRDAKGTRILLVSPGDEFAEQLAVQWKSERKK
jgi:hypothetical protein